MPKRKFTADQTAFCLRHQRSSHIRAYVYMAVLFAWFWLLVFAFFRPASDAVQNIAEWTIILIVIRSCVVQYLCMPIIFIYSVYLTTDKPQNTDTDKKMLDLLEEGISPIRRGLIHWYWWITTTAEIGAYILLAASAHFKSACLLVFGHLIQEFVCKDVLNKVSAWLGTLSPKRLVALDWGLTLVESSILSTIALHCKQLGAVIQLDRVLSFRFDDIPQSTFRLTIENGEILRLEEQHYDKMINYDHIIADPSSIDNLYDQLGDLVVKRRYEASHCQGPWHIE